MERAGSGRSRSGLMFEIVEVDPADGGATGFGAK